MKNFTEMDLSLVGVGDFQVEGLYCTYPAPSYSSSLPGGTLISHPRYAGLDDSPLQNQTLYPGCYGICAVRPPFSSPFFFSFVCRTIPSLYNFVGAPQNPDVSGIGNRISLYIQTILTREFLIVEVFLDEAD
jgi:hypothetical protein